MAMTDLNALRTTGLREGAIDQVRVRVLPDARMTRDDAARYLGHASKTLAVWALNNKGPRFVKIAGRVFYYKSELDSFISGPAAA